MTFMIRVKMHVDGRSRLQLKIMTGEEGGVLS